MIPSREKTQTAANGFRDRRQDKTENHPIPLVWDRQSKSALRRDLRTVRSKLAEVRNDPGRAKLTRLLDHLARQIRKELRK